MLEIICRKRTARVRFFDEYYLSGIGSVALASGAFAGGRLKEPNHSASPNDFSGALGDFDRCNAIWPDGFYLQLYTSRYQSGRKGESLD